MTPLTPFKGFTIPGGTEAPCPLRSIWSAAALFAV